MNKLLRLALLLSVVLMQGCTMPRAPTQPATQTTYGPYKKPVDGPTARLQIRSGKMAGAGFMLVFKDAANCRAPHPVAGTPGQAGEFQNSSILQAEQAQTLWFNYIAPGNRSCHSAITFVPARDKNYLLTAIANDTMCGLAITDITDAAAPTPVTRRVTRVTQGKPDAQGNYCAPVNLEEALAKSGKINRSGLQMSDLADILPATPKD